MPEPAAAPAAVAPYQPRRPSTSRFVQVRGLRYHLRCWGELTADGPPPLLMLHGWMDVSASFQFMVDAMAEGRALIAPDWRGFGLTERPATDTYWFADYLGDLDQLLDQALPDRPIDLLGHSMGGNAAMLYAGLRPERIRKLINLEGFGMPRTQPADAPRRLLQWLDELRTPPTLASYESADGVVRRLMKNNPRLPADKAAWLAGHWGALQADGRWHLQADAAHKGVSPVLHQVEESLLLWQRIEAPVLWVDGALTDLATFWGSRYSREEFEARLATLRAPVTRARLTASGHMLHHDEPEALAVQIEQFLAA